MPRVFVNQCWGRSIDQMCATKPKPPRRPKIMIRPFVEGMEFIHDPLPVGVQDAILNVLVGAPHTGLYDEVTGVLNSVCLNNFETMFESISAVSGSGHILGEALLDGLFSTLFKHGVKDYINRDTLFGSVLADDFTHKMKQAWVQFDDIMGREHKIKAWQGEYGGISVSTEGRTLDIFCRGRLPASYRTVLRHEFPVGYLLSEDEAEDLMELQRMVLNDASTGL